MKYTYLILLLVLFISCNEKPRIDGLPSGYPQEKDFKIINIKGCEFYILNRESGAYKAYGYMSPVDCSCIPNDKNKANEN
jgi:hypothetical protein